MFKKRGLVKRTNASRSKQGAGTYIHVRLFCKIELKVFVTLKKSKEGKSNLSKISARKPTAKPTKVLVFFFEQPAWLKGKK